VDPSSSSSSLVRVRSWFDPLRQVYLVGRGFADRKLGGRGPSTRHELLTNRPRIGHGPSVFQGVGICRESAEVSRTVLQPIADCPSGHCGMSSWGFVDSLSPLLLVLRFRVAFSLGLFLELVGPL
jgi:hypothetical protein